MGFVVQRVTRVTQQFHDASVHQVHLFGLEVLLPIIKEGSKIDGGHRHGLGNPFSLVLRDDVTLTASIVAIVHANCSMLLMRMAWCPRQAPFVGQKSM